MFNPLVTPPQLIAAAEKLNVAFPPSPLEVLAAPVGWTPGCGSQMSGGLLKG